MLRAEGHDALHTLDLPDGNRTTDEKINELSIRDRRVVITKDEDFVDSFLLAQRPYKLLFISTGNIVNSELEALFTTHLPEITDALASYDHVELSRAALIFHS
jgi:predicted nuclease of predicted toxin-antitoxin system